MLTRRDQGVLLRPADLPPSRSDFEVIGVFNPAAARHEGEVVLLVRVAERPRPDRPGFTGLPRWTAEHGFVVDWLANDDLEWIDSRVVRLKATGTVRLTFISYLGVARLGDGRAVPSISSLRFGPHTPWEEFGVEDPRLTWIGDRWYFTYVAVSRHGVATALASTRDFQTFDRHGVIFCPENKDVVLFPERIGGAHVAVHRPVGQQAFSRPEMWLARSADLVHWGDHEFLLSGVEDWESGRVGAGPPPLLTPAGWLLLYHGSRREPVLGAVGAYAVAAILLDRNDPSHILRRARAPLLAPQAPWEMQGFVPGVVFPTGWVADGDALLLYFGAADTCTAFVEVSLAELLASLAPTTKSNVHSA